VTVVLTGVSLSVEELLRVARDGERVEISPDALERMRARRSIVDATVESGTTAYGITTGVGMRREARVDGGAAAEFNRSALEGHRVGTGPPAARDAVRASLACMANGLAAGYQGARPEVALALVAALNDAVAPEVRSLGTVGEADLAMNADLAAGVLRDLPLAAGEAIALLASNAFSTAQAVLAIADADRLLRLCDVASALDFEALRGNVGALHPQVGEARPSRGVRATLERLQALLAGSELWEPDAARFLQDPLTFRCVPQIHGAARDALGFSRAQLAMELNAHQGNPLIVPDERRIVSVGNFESLPIAIALDLARIALAPVLTSAVERTLKLLSPRFSGLSEGLAERTGTWEDGLSELGVVAQAIGAEARLLAQPVSFELVSTMQESGVEDRAALSSLGARRLAEMTGLGHRIVALELVVAAQAVELRGTVGIGAGAEAARTFVRTHVPFVRNADDMPIPLEALADDLARLEGAA
jgi:histidine ammonia-lyase